MVQIAAHRPFSMGNPNLGLKNCFDLNPEIWLQSKNFCRRFYMQKQTETEK